MSRTSPAARRVVRRRQWPLAWVTRAIGTDTAGSIREPAALCGVVGLKPTYGRVSAQGVIPLSESLDHVGPIARTVADVTLLLRAIASEGDESAGLPSSDFLTAWKTSAKRWRIGVPRSYFFDDLDPEIAAAVEESLRVLASLSHELRDIPNFSPTPTGLCRLRKPTPSTRSLVKKHPPSISRRLCAGSRPGRILLATSICSRRKELEGARHSIRRVFETVDVIVTPTTPIAAPAIAELQENPELLRPRELLLLRNTRPFNVWGVPAISVPCGFTKSGLPIGLQIAAPPGREDFVLQLAYAYEQATQWHERWPQLSRPPLMTRRSCDQLRAGVRNSRQDAGATEDS